MDRRQAEKIYAQGKEATLLALLELAAQIASLQKHVQELESSKSAQPGSLSTPSGMKPPYEKPSAKGRRGKKPGRKKGHPGARRPKIREEDISHTEKHPLHVCPDCRDPVTLLDETRERFTEDIPEEKPELTRHIQQVGWCKTCKKGNFAKNELSGLEHHLACRMNRGARNGHTF